MATDQQLQQMRSEVEKGLETLLAMNVRQAATRPNLGDINFETAIPVVDRILGLFGMLRGVSLDYVSYHRLNELKNTIQEATDQLKQIEAFSLAVDNPKAQRDAIVQNLQNQYTNWFEKVFPVVSFAVRSQTDFAALERDLRNKIAQAEVISKELLEQQQAAAQQAQETLDSIKRAAAEAGVSQEAVHFKREAEEHEESAQFWFWATAGMAAVTVLWGVAVLWLLTVPTSATVPQLVQQTIGKLVILSGLYYGLVWCARNYAASRHNLIVNRHRQNALSTFETFVKAASTDDVKQAVLLQATTSIFSAAPSGYAGKEPESDQPSKVIEILRSVSATAKPASH